MKKIRENSAGIDIGAKSVFVYVEGEKVRNYFTFTEDFEKLRDYLLELKECIGLYCMKYVSNLV
jgi:transposase